MSSPCPHTSTVLLKLDCGAGGIQYRRYCTTCWRNISGAIPHERAREEEKRQGYDAPLADLELLHEARNRAWRSA